MTLPDKLSKKIDELWCKNLSLVYSRIETIQDAINGLRNDRLSRDLRAEAARQAHNLAGVLGTFGLQGGSEAAATIEQILDREFPFDRDDALALDGYLAQLRKEVDGRGKHS